MALSKDMSAKPNLFLKAIKQANDSVVKRPSKKDVFDLNTVIK